MSKVVVARGAVVVEVLPVGAGGGAGETGTAGATAAVAEGLAGDSQAAIPNTDPISASAEVLNGGRPDATSGRA